MIHFRIEVDNLLKLNLRKGNKNLHYILVSNILIKLQ